MVCKKPFQKFGTPVAFGCGQCMACRINTSRLWTSRILLESRLHEANCFVTLTYAPEHLPPGGTLVPRHYQLFLKRLRKKLAPRKVRYFFVGEYGDVSQRPHYHACLFGLSFLEHELVASCWPFGFVKLDELNEGTAGYVAQYVVKKWTNGKDRKVKEDLGGRHPEFARMSLRPHGLGAGAVKLIFGGYVEHSKGAPVPTSLRFDGTMRPLGRYLKNQIIKEFGTDAEEIQKFEKEVWLRSVHEERLQEMEQAKKEGKTYEEYRQEKNRQRFLNKVAKAKNRKQRRSL